MSPNHFLVILTLVLTSAFFLLFFYWFGYRPTKVRSDCSWVQRHQEATPFIPEKTETELREEGLLIECSPGVRDGRVIDFNDFCESLNKRTVEEYKQSRPAQPAKEWWQRASQREYEQCIREKGLVR